MEKWIARKGKTYAGHDDDHVMDVAEAADPSRVVFRGFWGNHERARVAAAAPELLEALEKLSNEASSFVSMAEPETHGHTNVAVLRGRIDDARAAIAKARGGV